MEEDYLQDFMQKSPNEIDRIFSYSRVRSFATEGPQGLIKYSSLNSDSVKLGLLVDDMINEKVNIKSRYFIYDGSKPTATLGKLTNIILENYAKRPNKTEVKNIVRDNKMWDNIKDEKLRQKRWDHPEFWNYLKIMFQGKKKTIVTTPIFLKAEEMAHILRTHEYSSWIFNKKKHKIIYQYTFEIVIEGLFFRGAIDLVLIDRKNKTVQIMDLKTGGEPALSFDKVFVRTRYYIQEAVYMKVFQHICESFNLKGYDLLPFKFLYISSKEKVPIVFNVSDKWHHAALKGFTTHDGYTYRGLYDLIDDIKWHYKNREFNRSRYLVESKGLIEISDNFFEVNE